MELNDSYNGLENKHIKVLLISKNTNNLDLVYRERKLKMTKVSVWSYFFDIMCISNTMSLLFHAF